MHQVEYEELVNERMPASLVLLKYLWSQETRFCFMKKMKTTGLLLKTTQENTIDQ